MKYVIIKVINGNYFIHAEGIEDLDSAKSQYHGLCQSLWNAPDVITACVAIMDEDLNIVYDSHASLFKEYITHEVPNNNNNEDV